MILEIENCFWKSDLGIFDSLLESQWKSNKKDYLEWFLNKNLFSVDTQNSTTEVTLVEQSHNTVGGAQW